eukprot:TRINITY_DN24259_c0_g2_i1.p1 TRINITY_DN24259_c0_g2~~TRINITY_DN24259_c0_g2_i1.p1  ORF type:complete len:108 (-),score=12.16 TRINITY_DN24259_c0_g2_i1:185-508(-)
MDVKNTFLHDDLKEKVYMKLPSGVTHQSKNDVRRLRLSLCSLKQAPRAWFEIFHHQTPCRSLFIQSKNDPPMFLQRSSSGIPVLPVYVDDIIITQSDKYGIQYLKTT